MIGIRFAGSNALVARTRTAAAVSVAVLALPCVADDGIRSTVVPQTPGNRWERPGAAELIQDRPLPRSEADLRGVPGDGFEPT
jgi:hypothetical protein